MELVRYTDARIFCDKALPFLLQHEAENNLMISVALRLADGTGKWGDDPPVLYAIEHAGQVVAAALQTPPYHLQLTRMEADAMAGLVEALQAGGHALPGVLGPIETVEAFATCWTDDRAIRAQMEKSMGVYQLDRVASPAHPGGHTAEATPADEALLVTWMREFNTLTHADIRAAEEIVQRGLEKRLFWLWKDPAPVSLAAFCGPTPHGMRINNVYTPTEYRGRGYASANVAALSQHLLDSGRRFCYLFTDLDNPTSNRIYQKIGYRRVCEFASYRFVDAEKA
ncbi:MAG TPA: GNAT family N-acetyltransferase [Armatimonadota bacterium]|nr:GNAT family N-acetyltransferase [Armatimonadota bacterium]